MNYYNENDPKAATWLRELIAHNLIADGIVDERSITEIKYHELTKYTQCHFFAGIGGWSYALRLAGWPDDCPVWTGSCPCQPFSCAGKGLGVADERHLWPIFGELIVQCKPATVFGEQVAGKAGREWLAGIRTDLENMGYAVGGSDLCAACVGAPHIRQRLYWCAIYRDSLEQRRTPDPDSGVAHDPSTRLERSAGQSIQRRIERLTRSSEFSTVSRMENAKGERLQWRNNGQQGQQTVGIGFLPAGPSVAGGAERGAIKQSSQASAWDNYELVPCRDGKSRRIESGTFPLVARLPRGMVPSGDPSVQEAQASAEFRVARLRGYGNSIVPKLASEFIIASCEAINETII